MSSQSPPGTPCIPKFLAVRGRSPSAAAKIFQARAPGRTALHSSGRAALGDRARSGSGGHRQLRVAPVRRGRGLAGLPSKKYRVAAAPFYLQQPGTWQARVRKCSVIISTHRQTGDEEFSPGFFHAPGSARLPARRHDRRPRSGNSSRSISIRSRPSTN